MSVILETTIRRYIGDTADAKPTGVPAGSTYFDRQTSILYVTYDGTNWVAKSTIAKLGANSGVDIGDVDVTSTIPGTGATNLGKAEDAVHASGDTGVMALAVQKATAVALGADGDYEPLEVDASGRLHVVQSGLELADDAGFTVGTSKVLPIGAMADEVAPDSVDEGDIGVLRMTLSRILWAAIKGKNAASADVELKLDTNGRTPVVFNASAMTDDGRTDAAAVSLEGSSTGRPLGIANFIWNGTTNDRMRGNMPGAVALASAARTAEANSADLVNFNHRGVRVRVNVTAITDTPSITVNIQEKDSISGNYITILTSAAIVATGQKTTLVVYPGCAAVANAVADQPLPRVWRVNVAHADADSITYSIDYTYVL